MFVPKDMSSSREFRSFYQTLLPNFSPPDLDELEKLYPDPGLHSHSPYKETRAGLGAQFRRIEASYAHWAYIAPVRHTVHLASQQGLEKKDSSSPAYLYHFDVRTTRNGGANHTDQGPFVTFESSVTRKSFFQKKVAGFMHAYWTSFILTGDPNAVPGGWPERPQWPAYHPIGGEKMVFGEGNDEWLGGTNLGISAQVTPDTWAQRECNFWWSKTMPPVAPRAAKL
jgi:triacylglycerol lipase